MVRKNHKINSCLRNSKVIAKGMFNSVNDMFKLMVAHFLTTLYKHDLKA